LIGEQHQQAEAWLKTRFQAEQPPCEPTDLHCEFICESTKNANNLMTHVFISYATDDKELMLSIRRSLMRERFTVWTNKTDLKTGVEFQAEINRGIEHADNLVYLISTASIQSPYCQQELAYAFSLNKRVIGILIQEIDLKLIPDQTRALQFIDLTGHKDPGKLVGWV